MSIIETGSKLYKNPYIRWAAYGAFSILFLYWLMHYNFLGTLQSLLSPQLAIFSIVILLVLFLMQFLRSWRLSCLLSKSYSKPDKKAYRVSVIHNFLGMLLPAKFGELSFLVLANKFGLKIQDSTKMLLHMRLLDLTLVLALFLFSGKSFFEVISLSHTYIYVLLVIAIIAFVFRKTFFKALKWISMDITTFKPALLLSIFILICHVLGTWLTVTAFGAGFTFFQTLSIVGAGMLAFALPLSGIANTGPYHAIWILAAELYGQDPKIALAAGTTYHFLAFLSLSLQAGYVRWMQKALD